MTAWQDQPPLITKPLSRREVRESERGAAADSSIASEIVVAVDRIPSEPVSVAVAPIGRRSQRSSELATDSEIPDSASGDRAREVNRVNDVNFSVESVTAAAELDAQPVPVEERSVSRRELRAREVRTLPGLEKPEISDPLAQITTSPKSATDTSDALALGLHPVLEMEQPLRRSRTRLLSTEQDSGSAGALAEDNARAAASQSETEKLAAVPPLVDPDPGAARPVHDQIGAAAGEPSSWTPPTGHWSTQAAIDDDEQIQENTLSRNIAETSGAVTTNALVLPVLPVGDLTRPLGSTGEILITGTIDLPRGYGTTGALPARYDHSDVDTLLEATDREDAEANPESAPVSAINAVNTNTSTLGALDLKKARSGSRLPLFLGVAATVVLAGIVVLVIAAIGFGAFK